MIKLMLVTLLGLTSLGGALSSVSADTYYHAQGTGKTYQYFYQTGCQWHDGRVGSGLPCYKGVWASTEKSGAVVYVYDRAQKHTYACGGPDICSLYYEFFAPNPYEASATSVVTSVGQHYWCGDSGCNYYKNVVGYANHYNLNYSYYIYWYTQGMIWKCQSPLPPSAC